MLGVAIFLLIINIFFMLFCFVKLSKKYSDTNIIKNVQIEAKRLITDIAFQTDKSVTVIEDKIKEAKLVIDELHKTITLSDKEKKNRENENIILNNLNVNKSHEKKIGNKDHKDILLENIINEEQNLSEPVKIYTKQILAKPNKNYITVKASYNEQIIEMAKKGLSTELISEKIPLPKGEIELIISMSGI